MEDEIKIGKKIFIRNIGKDEYWLQDIIFNNPEKLGLGNLIPVNKEKIQSSGGRLDILLKDPNDNSMYEIEVMLGETDPSHIIRTIEYWDNEKRRYPQRQHFAVLIAEKFNRRYFNVIQLLSLNVPMIAIQAELIEIENQRILKFTKILDIYVEPEDETEAKKVTEKTWKDKAPWTLELAKRHLEILSEIGEKPKLNFTQSYISIVINNKNNYYYDKRNRPTSSLWVNVKDEEKADAIKKIFESKKIDYVYNKSKDFNLTYDMNFLNENKDLFIEIHKIKNKEFISED